MSAKKRIIIFITLVVTVVAAVICLSACQRIAVYGVTLNETYLEMNVGDTTVLSATVDAENVIPKVVWSSAHTNIATVNDGVVTAVSSGATSIKAVVRDKVAVCTVVVKSTGQQDPSGIILDPDELNLEVGKEHFLYVAAWTGSIVVTNVTWQSLNSAVATVDGGIVKGVGAGTAFIVATYGDKQAVCKVNVLAPQSGETLTFKTLNNENGIISGEYLQNADNTFDFNAEIVAGAGVSYIVCTDIECTNVVRSKVVTLQEGLNRFYILSTRNNVDKLYQVVLNVLPMYSVVINTQGCPDADVECEDILQSSGVYAEGQSVTITVKSKPLGYIFEGFYKDNEIVSTDLTYTFEMPPNTVLCTAKFRVDERVDNLDFESTSATFKINGFKAGADADELVVPEYTTEIESGVFQNCRINIMRWLVPQFDKYYTSENGPFYGCIVKKLYLNTNVLKIGTNVFREIHCNDIHYNGDLTDWLQVEFCGRDNPMYYCQRWYLGDSVTPVTELVIPEGVTEIKARSFDGARFLATVRFPSTLKRIAYLAFGYCTLKNISFPDGLEYIGQSAFWYCPLNNQPLVLPSSLTSIGHNAFGYTQAETVVLPSNLINISDQIFWNNTNLKNVLFEGTYSQWTQFADNVLLQYGANDELLSAKIYTSNLAVADNPNGNYWKWSYNTDGVRIPVTYDLK